MSLAIPISVTLATRRNARRVTKLIGDISGVRTVIPGGYASAQVRFSYPLILQPDELDYYADLTFTDTRNGTIVWQGRVEDLNRATDNSGQIWELSALGTSAYIRDHKLPAIYADQRIDVWFDSGRNSPTAETGGSTDSGDVAALKLGASEGNTMNSDWNAEMVYESAYIAGQRLARVVVVWDGGNTGAGFLVRTISRTNRGGSDVLLGSVALTTTGGTLTDTFATDLVEGENILYFRLDSTGSAVVPAETWVLGTPFIRTELMNKSGAWINDPAQYTSNAIYATAIVEDLLGRLLGDVIDGANAYVEQSVYIIDQIAYDAGVTPADIMDDLMMLEPSFYWAVWEKQANGKYRFEWRSFDNTVRYDASLHDGFSAPGSVSDLYNAVTVQWKSPGGQTQITRVSSIVPELVAANLTRRELLDLGEDIGSLANAAQIGASFLAEHSTPVSAAQLTVARPILDRYTGRYVSPWEIQPGYLVRVRGVSTHKDPLNISRDGATIFRIVSTDWSTDGTASLELDTFSQTVARAVSLQKRSWAAKRANR